MHLDNKQDEMKTLLAQRDKEQGMVDKGIARSQKDRKRKDLDQNKAAFELIEQSIAGVMRGLQDQIDIAENRKGGPAPSDNHNRLAACHTLRVPSSIHSFSP